jgi:hypothetical protein
MGRRSFLPAAMLKIFCRRFVPIGEAVNCTRSVFRDQNFLSLGAAEAF